MSDEGDCECANVVEGQVFLGNQVQRDPPTHFCYSGCGGSMLGVQGKGVGRNPIAESTGAEGFVEQEPDKQLARQNFWRAVDAIKTMAKEEVDYIIDPRAFVIYGAKEYKEIGRSSPEVFDWHVVRLKLRLPGIDVAKLRRATIISSRRS